MDSSTFSWGLAQEKGVQLGMCCLLPPSPFSAASGQGDRAAAEVAEAVVPAARRLPGQESSLFHVGYSVVQGQETHVPVYFQ